MRPANPRQLEFVITYLEMTEKPSITPFFPGDLKFAFLRAENPTLSFYRYLYDTVGEPWLWWERRAMDDEALAEIIHDENVGIYVLYVNGVPAGFAELDRRGGGEIDLAYFGLIPDFIGRGFGHFLLHSTIDTAWSYEPDRITVNTCNYDHPKAVQTYQQAGFQPFRQERKMVDDPRDLGLIPADIVHAND